MFAEKENYRHKQTVFCQAVTKQIIAHIMANISRFLNSVHKKNHYTRKKNPTNLTTLNLFPRLQLNTKRKHRCFITQLQSELFQVCEFGTLLRFWDPN